MSPPPDCDIPIVGVGASAGGLGAFTRLLRAVPSDTGYGFVLVQHLDAHHPSSLSQILGRVTPMPVDEARDGKLVEANRVFVIPPNTKLTVAGGVLRLSARQQPLLSHRPIDQFLESLARDCGSRAIGVILSGAGSDGAAGLLAIKEAGGVTFVQEPATAEFTGMPTMAAAAGNVDFILSPERIAAELARIARHPYFVVPRPAGEAEPLSAVDGPDAYREICEVMREATGIDFSLYRKTSVSRRIMRRLALRNIASIDEYAGLLAADSDECTALLRDVLIGVTSFFREPDSFQGLKEIVFPSIVRDRAASHTVRIWVPGCASGEEAYSLLIAFQEYQRERDIVFPVRVFASDVNEVAIQKARAGRYSERSVAALSPERRRQYFTKIDDGYQIAQSIRGRCTFSLHNLLDDPPFSKLDLISCRNVLIYLDAVQKAIIPLFHYALEAHGFLMLGRSETAHFPELFSIVDPRWPIFAKRNTGRKPAAVLAPAGIPRGGRDGGIISAAAQPVTLRDGIDGSREADRILASKYSPPAVLVDEHLQVLEIRGRPVPFLTLPDGKVNFHLLTLLRDTSLFLEVERLVAESAQTAGPVQGERIAYDNEGRAAELTVQVTPIGNGNRRTHLVLFDMEHTDGAASGQAPPDREAAETTRDRQIARLKQELEFVRQRLVSVIEEHETSDEEHHQVTADALSANEELQSLTEELETAKEELQSTNEELLCINQDLEAMNAALTSARDFSKSIVETVRVPLVVVGGDLAIRSINASFANTFQVSIRQMEGQPFFSLCGGVWDLPEARSLIESAVKQGRPFDAFEVEREFPLIGLRVVAMSGRRLDHLELILLTIEDLTAQREIKKALRRSEEQRRQAEKMEAVGRLAGGIAHDFNNLLTVIIGHCGLLSDTVADNREAAEQVDQIRRSADRAAALTDQLLAFGRQKVLQPRVLDLNTIVTEFERMLRRLLGETIRIVVRNTPDLWPVTADPGEIGRVVMNLCLNARDAMPAGGTLTLQTDNVSFDEQEARRHDVSPGKFARLIVRDTGIGMEADTRAHIFEPFFTTKEMTKGAGLGLATVLGIVQQSGGAIACESALAGGTKFTIWLPSAESVAGEAEPAMRGLSQVPKGSSEVVLLVEDELSLRLLERKILEKADYIVLEASHGREALSIIETCSGSIDILVTDLVLPELGGRELVERALAIRPAMKVLFVSGHTEDAILKQGVTRGTPFLQKPFTPVHLARKVREVLDAAGSDQPAP